jgi:hypothetical protein
MSLCGNYARVIGLEVEAKILRVVGEPLQRMVGVNTRRVRFADISSSQKQATQTKRSTSSEDPTTLEFLKIGIICVFLFRGSLHCFL